MTLKEIRIHGRGGQGAVTSSQVLAIAAFKDGKHSQAFPNFGVERTGAPVEAYVRIDDKPVLVRQQVDEPDYAIVLDATLLETVDVTDGLRKGGMLIVNTDKSSGELRKEVGKGFKICPINITKIALEVIGKPFVNIAALGAFCSLTGEVSVQALEKAIDEQFAESGKEQAAALNKKAAKAVANACK